MAVPCQVSAEPSEIIAQRVAVAPCRDLLRTARVGMLAVLVPHLAGRVERPAQTDLGEDNAVLVHAAERLLVAADLAQHVAPEQQPARREHIVAQEPDEQVRRLHQRVGRTAERLDVVAREVGLLTRPSVPHMEAPIDRSGGRVLQQQIDLPVELLGDPDIVAIQERDHLAAGMGEAQVARCTHAPVRAIRVLQVANPVGVLRRTASRDRGRAVGRAVIAQQQLPRRVGLREHALDRLRKEAFFVVEDRDDGDQRLRPHPGSRSYPCDFDAGEAVVLADRPSLRMSIVRPDAAASMA
jgi:hypothetical protein